MRARGPPTSSTASVPVGLEVGQPGPQGEGVVLAQALDVTDLEAGLAAAR